MFTPKTEKIKKIYQVQPKGADQIHSLFYGNVNIYIDYANVRPWAEHLGWHIDIRRLKQFFDSFGQIKKVNFYNGYLVGDQSSIHFMRNVKRYKYVLRTKPVKIMRHSIDVSSVSPQSTAIINQYIRGALVRKLEIGDIEIINRMLSRLNSKGVYFIEDRKCNFDVELASDMIVDLKMNNIDTYVLWSGDSDFADPIEQLLDAGKKAILFATARKVSAELNRLRGKGLIIFDIKKIKNFVCRPKEIDQNITF
jgi:uncharacterized LabA/DUF88 family protein